MRQQFDKCKYPHKHMAAYMYRTAADSIAKATIEKIVLDTIYFDPYGICDLVNGHITPTKAGYYLVAGCVSFAAFPDADYGMSYIYKNAGVIAMGAKHGTGVATTLSCPAMVLVYCDGNDSLELWGYHSYAGTKALTEGQEYLFLCCIGPF